MSDTVRRFLLEFPRLLRDAPRVVRRMRANDYKDIPAVDKRRFPPYYRRTFHWQTDGYFSEHSAEVYELGVELLCSKPGAGALSIGDELIPLKEAKPLPSSD